MADHETKKFDPWQLGIFVAAIVGVFLISRMSGSVMDNVKTAIAYAALVLVFMYGLSVIAAIIRGQIDLKYLIAEMDGDASMSRFQLLIFTFVIAMGFLYLTISSGTFPTVSGEVLTLLGLSASTYAVSKGIQVSSGQTGGTSGDTTEPPPPPDKGKGVGAGE
jgi:hypothetical protein